MNLLSRGTKLLLRTILLLLAVLHTGLSLAQANEEHIAALQRLHEIANEELSKAIAAFSPAERAEIESRKIQVSVLPAESPLCSALGGLGASTSTSTTIDLTLCAFPLLALSQSHFGMLLLALPPAGLAQAPSSYLESYWTYQADRYAHGHAAAVLARHEIAKPWCMGLHAAWMILQSRSASDCETISDSERALARNEAKRVFDLLGQKLGSDEEVGQALAGIYMMIYRNAFRFTLAHELGHAVDKDVTPDRVALLTRLSPGFTRSMLAELNADWYGLNSLSLTYSPTFAVALELFWTSLRLVAPLDLPLEREIVARAGAIRNTAGCRRGGYQSLKKWAESETRISPEAIAAMTEYHQYQCQLTEKLERLMSEEAIDND